MNERKTRSLRWDRADRWLARRHLHCDDLITREFIERLEEYLFWAEALERRVGESLKDAPKDTARLLTKWARGGKKLRRDLEMLQKGRDHE